MGEWEHRRYCIFLRGKDLATIIIDGVTQPGNTGEGTYPIFTIDSGTGLFTIQLSASTGTAGSYSGGQQYYADVWGDDQHIYEWKFHPVASQYTPPANLPSV